VYGWHLNGVEITDGDGDPRTEGILADEGLGGYRASLAVGQLDSDPYPEIVGAAWGDVGPPEQPSYEVWAWNAEDGSPLPGWPVTTSRFCWATPSLADLDHDGLDEVILPCANGYLYVWKADGEELIDGDSNPSTIGIFKYLEYSWAYASAAVVDIDQDHDLEILVPSRSSKVYCLNPDGTSVPGWPVNLGASSRGSVAVGDVNNNGHIEVVATTSQGKVYLLSDDGQVFPNWPRTLALTGDFPSSPSLADLDGDGDLEIMLVSSEGSVRVYSWEGVPLAGWPQQIDNLAQTEVQSSISVGDIDGDAGLELITGSACGKVYAFNTDGSPVPGWPIQTDGEVFSSPTITDLDNDGDVEVIVSGMDQNVYVWDTSGDYDDGDGVAWGNWRHNNRRNGFHDYELEVGVPDDETWSASPGVKLEQNVPNPFNPVTTITYSIPEGGSEIDLSIYNVAGVRVTTLVGGKVDGGRASVVWDGTDAHGRHVASGVYFVRLTAEDASLARKIVLLK
ncbi:MAG: VCBS repeat-containing protein, partial [Candidatus Eisenbacteria bacterium]|nr:VCBS repeat-containing protein [Candidatus Eisenbacteria bacterium]